MPQKTREARIAYFRAYRARKRAEDAGWQRRAREASKLCKVANREWFEEFKRGYACLVCGDDHPAALDFHHRDPTTKTKGVAQLVCLGYGRDTIIAEVAKCDPLCASCHRKLEWRRRHGIPDEVADLPWNEQVQHAGKGGPCTSSLRQAATDF